jgi:hypothetical protein
MPCLCNDCIRVRVPYNREEKKQIYCLLDVQTNEEKEKIHGLCNLQQKAAVVIYLILRYLYPFF